MPKHIRPTKRPESGSMLVFGTAITIAIVAVLAFFSLSYVRLLGSSSEQRTAIEAAALAAARDLV
jgi:heme/copper-type cytochrome/quinol oxidase subunit 2